MKKYQQIEHWVKEKIKANEHFPNDKLPSESELCEKFGVSRNVARRAIRGLTEEGWVYTVKGVGTFCVKKVAHLNKHSKTIALVCFVSEAYDFPKFLNACDQSLHAKGYHIQLHQSLYNLKRELEILNKLKESPIAGIIIEPILFPNGKSNLKMLKEIKETGIPMVICDTTFIGENFDSVIQDNREGGKLAASCLYKNGYRKFGILYSNIYHPLEDRVHGALEFLGRMKIKIPEEHILTYDIRDPNSLEPMIDKLLNKTPNRPEAIICSTDFEAMHLGEAAYKAGLKIPGDIAITGFDNSEMASFEGFFSLTTVENPRQYVGEKAAQIILEKISNPSHTSTTNIVVRPQLVERNSSGRRE